MLDYFKAVAAKSVGVFGTTLVGSIGASEALDVGVGDIGSAFEVSLAAVLVTVVWPAASKVFTRLQATKVPDPPKF